MRYLLILATLFMLQCSSKSGDSDKNNIDMADQGDCENLTQLVATINEHPDMLHLDYTPSVHDLCGCGYEAATAILPLLDSDDELERLRAQRVLEGVVQRKYGWKSGQGFPQNSTGENEVRTLLEEMGNYQFDNSKEERRASIEKWKNWLQGKLEAGE